MRVLLGLLFGFFSRDLAAQERCVTAARWNERASGALRLAGSAKTPLSRAPGGSMFWSFIDEGGAVSRSTVCSSADVGDALLYELYTSYLAEGGEDVHFAVIWLSRPVDCNNDGMQTGAERAVFYTPLSNDVQGIGYGHTDPRDTYDGTPQRDLEGILFLNDLPYWRSFPFELPIIFNQELAHRWAALVWADFGDESGASPLLLGRASAHWSYFLHTDASPMEGNRWLDNGDGTFTTATEPDDFHYHPLDLYLMGLMPPSEVPPTFLLQNPTTTGLEDCFENAIWHSSPPQFCAPVTVSAERREVRVDHVIQAEGPRDPAFPDAPSEFRLAHLLLLHSDDLAAGRELCQDGDALIEDATDKFIEATGDRAQLEVRTAGTSRCEDLSDGADGGCGCQLGGRTTTPSSTLLRFLPLLPLLGAIAVRARRPLRFPRGSR